MPEEGDLEAVEEAEESDPSKEGTSAQVADQAEIDRAAAEARTAAQKAAWAKRSEALKRGLPRPTAVNNSVLRPTDDDSSLTDIQKVSPSFLLLRLKCTL